MIKLVKDRLDALDTNGIVYKINCLNCSATYIGMSKRKLGKHTYEHKRAVKLGSENSALPVHTQDTGHSIDFDMIIILDKETNYFKRTFSEMMNIHYQSNTLNRMEDTHFLKNAYKKTIDTIKKLHI